MTEIVSETTPIPPASQRARIYGPDNSSTAKCDSCGECTLATNLYYGLHNCSKGGPSKVFISTFKVIEPKVDPKKQISKKKPAAASKASTPVKEQAEDSKKEQSAKGDSSKNPDSGEKVAQGNKKSQEKDEESPKESKKRKTVESAKESKADVGEVSEKTKRPMSAYLLFSNAMRPTVMAENPGSKITEVAKVLGAKWKEMGDEEKQTWNDQAAKLKAEYAEKTGRGTEKTEKKAKKTEAKDDSPPHIAKAKSAYVIWSASAREKVKEEHPGIKAKEILSILSDMWKNLSSEEKAQFEAEAAKYKSNNSEGNEAKLSNGNDDKEPATPQHAGDATEDAEMESEPPLSTQQLKKGKGADATGGAEPKRKRVKFQSDSDSEVAKDVTPDGGNEVAASDDKEVEPEVARDENEAECAGDVEKEVDMEKAVDVEQNVEESAAAQVGAQYEG